MTSMRRVLAGGLSAALLTGLLATGAAAAGFERGKSYTQGQFTDVAAGAWYGQSVKDCFELGLMSGSSASTFNPNGMFTVAEAATIAARMHNIYNGGSGTIPAAAGAWYQGAVDYCIQNGIFKDGAFDRYTRAATRAEMAGLMAAALPDAAWPAKNSVTALPDVSEGTPYSQAIFQLYDAGVFTGSDEYGMFQPYAYITRAEVAAIAARAADPAQRKTVALTPMTQRQAPVIPSSYFGKVSNGRLSFQDKATGKYGYIDGNGSVMVPAIYKYVMDFVNGYAVVSDGYKYGLIDTSGNVTVPLAYSQLDWNGTYGLAKSSGTALIVNGRLATSVLYSEIEAMADGRFLLKSGDRYGVLDADGREVVPCTYKSVERDVVSKDVTYYVCQGDSGYELYSYAGERLGSAPSTYTHVSGRLFTVKDGYKYALASLNGPITEAIYDEVCAGYWYRDEMRTVESGVWPNNKTTEVAHYDDGAQIEKLGTGGGEMAIVVIGESAGLAGLNGEILAPGTQSKWDVSIITEYGYACVTDYSERYGSVFANREELDGKFYTSAGKISKEEAKGMWPVDPATGGKGTAAGQYRTTTGSSGKPIAQYSSDGKDWTTVIEYYKNDLRYDELRYLGEDYFACRYNTTWYLVHP